MSTYFGNDDVYFSMTVTFKNIASVLVKNLTCEYCTVDVTYVLSGSDAFISSLRKASNVM